MRGWGPFKKLIGIETTYDLQNYNCMTCKLYYHFFMLRLLQNESSCVCACNLEYTNEMSVLITSKTVLDAMSLRCRGDFGLTTIAGKRRRGH